MKTMIKRMIQVALIKKIYNRFSQKNLSRY